MSHVYVCIRFQFDVQHACMSGVELNHRYYGNISGNERSKKLDGLCGKKKAEEL